MNNQQGQSFTIYLFLLSLAFGLFFAGKNFFHEKKAQEINLSLAVEADNFLNKIEAIVKDPALCTLNFKGKNKNTLIEHLNDEDSKPPEYLFKAGKIEGRLKLDFMELVPGNISENESSVTFNIHVSNFSNEETKSIVGITSFKKSIELKVSDCQVFHTIGDSSEDSEIKCRELRGTKIKTFSTDLSEPKTVSSVTQCRVCPMNRDQIISCL